MKKKDIIFIGILCIVIGVGYGIYMMFQGEKEVIQVYHQNKMIAEVNINENKTYDFKGNYGNFSLEVKDGQYHAVNVDCPNHDCEKVGWVKKGSSKQIVCVPNDIYVIQSEAVDQIQ